jgi:hypothetical protein
LDAHGLTGVEAPPTWTVGAGVALLALQGVDPREIAERFMLSCENQVAVMCSQYRKKHSMTLQAWRAQIATNIALRRGGGRGGAPTTLAPLKAARDEPAVPEGLPPEVYAFIDSIWLNTLMNEVRAQGRDLSIEEVAALPEYAQMALNQSAICREAQAALGPKR